MKITFRRLFGAVLVLAGALVIGTTAAFASTSAGTTLNLTVPSSLSISGLAANYSATAPAGIMTEIDTPIIVSTNNSTGFTLTLAAGSANFVGSHPSNTFPAGSDMIAACDTTCVPSLQALTTGGVQVLTHNTAGPTNVGVIHQITIPGGAPADTYSLAVTYTVVDNP